MAKPRGRSLVTEGPYPDDLKVFLNVQIHEILYDLSKSPYFDLSVSSSETHRVRIHHSATQWIEWINAHLDTPLNVTLFPYKWIAGDRSGTVYYFQTAEIR